MFEKLFNKFKILSGPSSDNKTLKLLEAAANDVNSCVICPNAADAKYLKSVIKENNWNIEVFTFNQFAKKDFQYSEVKSFYFLNVDKMFRGVVYPKKIKMLSFDSNNIEYVKGDEE